MARTTVLIVEDDDGLAGLYESWLADDYETRLAGNASAGLDRFDDDVDVALLDRRLPDGTGEDVLDAIRDAGTDCQVAMVTAVVPDVDVVEMGFDEYLVKPVTADVLRGTVARLETRAEYADDVREFFALASKAAALEAAKDPEELRNSDEYAALRECVEASRRAADRALDGLSDADVRTLFRTVGRRGDGETGETTETTTRGP